MSCIEEKNEEGFKKEESLMKRAFARLFPPKILEEENISLLSNPCLTAIQNDKC